MSHYVATLLCTTVIPEGIKPNLNRITNVMDSRKDKLAFISAFVLLLLEKIHTYGDVMFNVLIFNENHFYFSL